MEKILVTRKIPQQFIHQLEQLGDVVMWDQELTPMSRNHFLTEVEDATACLITLSEKVYDEVFERAQHLKVISNMAVGYDSIDLKLAQQHHITAVSYPHL